MSEGWHRDRDRVWGKGRGTLRHWIWIGGVLSAGEREGAWQRDGSFSAHRPRLEARMGLTRHEHIRAPGLGSSSRAPLKGSVFPEWQSLSWTEKTQIQLGLKVCAYNGDNGVSAYRQFWGDFGIKCYIYHNLLSTDLTEKKQMSVNFFF